MDIEGKRMEEGINNTLSKMENGGGDSIEHDRDTTKVECVEQTMEQEEQLSVKQRRTKRVATLDAFRGLTIVVSLVYLFGESFFDEMTNKHYTHNYS